MPLVDEDTRRLLLKKTWCHGQLVLPAFALWYFWLFIQGKGLCFLYGCIVLPCWSYYSWETISADTHHTNSGIPSKVFQKFIVGGFLVEIAHFGIFLTALQDGISTTINLFLVITSGLLFIETAAFIGVVGMCRRRVGNSASTNDVGYNEIL